MGPSDGWWLLKISEMKSCFLFEINAAQIFRNMQENLEKDFFFYLIESGKVLAQAAVFKSFTFRF